MTSPPSANLFIWRKKVKAWDRRLLLNNEYCNENSIVFLENQHFLIYNYENQNSVIKQNIFPMLK